MQRPASKSVVFFHHFEFTYDFECGAPDWRIISDIIYAKNSNCS